MTAPNWRDYQYFSAEEFECRCGCGRSDMNHDFMLKLDNLRANLGGPIIINSGFRCPEHNAAVSSTGLNGPHTTGKAADLGVSYHRGRKLLDLAVVHFPGIGIKQHGDVGGRFVHLDTLGYRVWTYG